LRPDGDRRLGGGRRRFDETVRLHDVQAGAGPRRPLHPDRPLLPDVEGTRVRLHDRVHRARRQGQPEHAVLLPLADLAGAQPRAAAVAARLEAARPRRLVQGGHRRHPRVAGAEADRAAAPRRGRRRLPRSLRARAPGARAPLGPARPGRARLHRDRDRPLEYRLRPARGGRPPRRRLPERHRPERLREREGLEAVIRVGVAGLGYWGPNLARNFDDLAELRWLCDMSDAARSRFAQRYPNARVTGDFDDVLGDPELDAVVIATPVPTHYDL